MAVYQGARRQSVFFPGRVARREIPAPPPRRRVRAAVRARRRPSRVGVLLGGIALAFVLAFFSLSFDHRVIDGSVADQFLATVKRTLETYAESGA